MFRIIYYLMWILWSFNNFPINSNNPLFVRYLSFLKLLRKICRLDKTKLYIEESRKSPLSTKIFRIKRGNHFAITWGRYILCRQQTPPTHKITLRAVPCQISAEIEANPVLLELRSKQISLVFLLSSPSSSTNRRQIH